MNRRTAIMTVLVFVTLAARPVEAGFVNGGLYATAGDLNQVIQINSDGSWGTALNVLTLPTGLAFRNANELYVTGRPNGVDGVGAVADYRSDGSTVFTVSSVPVSNIWPNGSWGSALVIDSQGNAYIPTWNSPGATKVTPDGSASDWTGYQYGLWWGKAAALSPSGQLYMIQGLNFGPNPTSTLATINTVTGTVNYVLQNLPLLNGIAIDSKGDIYLSEYLQNEIVKIAAGTDRITPFASLAAADASNAIAIGPDGRLYALAATQTGTDQIWSFNLSTGGASLYASNLPALTDIAFAPGPNAPPFGGASVPEPSTLVMALTAIVLTAASAARKQGKLTRRQPTDRARASDRSTERNRGFSLSPIRAH